MRAALLCLSKPKGGSLMCFGATGRRGNGRAVVARVPAGTVRWRDHDAHEDDDGCEPEEGADARSRFQAFALAIEGAPSSALRRRHRGRLLVSGRCLETVVVLPGAGAGQEQSWCRDDVTRADPRVEHGGEVNDKVGQDVDEDEHVS